MASFDFIEVRPGLTDAEFADIERRFGFEFADDHRAFLAVGLPVWTQGDDDPEQASWGWPDWRDGDPETLQSQVNWPTTIVRYAVSDGYWPRAWGPRPESPEAAAVALDARLADVPRMIPVYAHRYLPAGRGTSGHPVLSVHSLSDTIFYGRDLAHYIGREFAADESRDGEEPWTAEATVPFWRDYVSARTN
ncbi:hypothetical protein ABT297_10135 [Dactylosporangium sp. NPDC000555]|uniref:hypothetical protein n=1 Tax=Dactylosporangium sp. NPDC000555 TaxID=3154260 RepID=UPI0033265573